MDVSNCIKCTELYIYICTYCYYVHYSNCIRDVAIACASARPGIVHVAAALAGDASNERKQRATALNECKQRATASQ